MANAKSQKKKNNNNLKWVREIKNTIHKLRNFKLKKQTIPNRIKDRTH